MNFLDVVERSWPLLGRLTGLHTFAYRATKGVIGHRIPGAFSMLLLDHVGAKSGEKRTSPLLYLADGDDLVIVASKGGHPQNPAWFHNLRANPVTTVQVGSEKRKVRARVANGEERSRLWPKLVEMYGPYRDYQRRADKMDREIPLVILEPAGRVDSPTEARAPRSAARAR
ncbi:MAG TPA: nitroreductase family deazaflavin-dependent oxidoreductase [Thermoleophilaceae bacterium]|nr:nitroreductase family deazaflavin-dependent oxidoreductase [Thermoleophilaceae bacterium]